MLDQLPQTNPPPANNPVTFPPVPPPPPVQEVPPVVPAPPPPPKTAKTKTILAALAVLLLIISVPTAVYLAKQRQEVRKEATGESCKYCENCENSTTKTHQCNGLKREDGTCGYDSSVTPNCTECKLCGDGTCDVCEGADWCSADCGGGGGGGAQITCGADDKGIWVENTGEQPVTVAFNWFAKYCEGASCFCSGEPSKEPSVPLGPHQKITRGFTNDPPPLPACNWSWQTDVTVTGNFTCHASDHGCDNRPCGTGTPMPTATTTPSASSCQGRKVYSVDGTNWTEVTNPNNITVGQTVYFTVTGTTADPGGVTKARFRINSGAWQETITKHGQEFYISYTIPSAGYYIVEAEVFAAGGWH